MASRRSLCGLDWFAFFVADIQTGWGPFVATYLTSVAWTQFDIGLILTIGTITGLTLQIPAGALVDRVPAKRFLAAVAVASISASALLLALWPTLSVVIVAKILHAIASSLLGPSLVAISLGLVGYASFQRQVGPQRALSLVRKRGGRRPCGDHRLLFFESGDFLFHGRARYPDVHRFVADQIFRNRSGTCPWRDSKKRCSPRLRSNFRAAAQSRAAHICRRYRSVPARQRRHAADPGRRTR